MGTESWKKEFYAGEIEDIAEMSEIAAVEHCLVKWKGLKEKNLDKHKLTTRPSECEIVDRKTGVIISVNSETCALCWRHHNVCSNCSLAATLGHMPCYNHWAESAEDSYTPFTHWTFFNDPKPMIKALKTTLSRLKRNEKQK